jgi:hypothetical protein
VLEVSPTLPTVVLFQLPLAYCSRPKALVVGKGYDRNRRLERNTDKREAKRNSSRQT